RRAGMRERANLHFEHVFVHPASTSQQRQRAADALELHQTDGMLLTADQAREYRETQRRVAEAVAVWLPKIQSRQSRWEHTDRPTVHNAVKAEIAAVDDSAILSAILLAMPDLSSGVAEPLVVKVREFQGATACSVLAEFAMQPFSESVRESALDALRER